MHKSCLFSGPEDRLRPQLGHPRAPARPALQPRGPDPEDPRLRPRPLLLQLAVKAEANQENPGKNEPRREKGQKWERERLGIFSGQNCPQRLHGPGAEKGTQGGLIPLFGRN